jgi:hypothetical protein
MRSLPLRFLALAALLMPLLATACSRCGAEQKDLLALLPADVPGAVVFPDLKSTSAGLKGLMQKFSVGPLATFINQGHIELKRALGFDPLEEAELRKLGVDPSLGLAMVPQPGAALVVWGVADKKVMETELQARMKQLTAADQVATRDVEGVTVTTLSDRNSPRLHYAFAGSFVLIAQGDSDPAWVARVARQKPADSLAQAAWFRSLRAQAPARSDLLLVVNAARAEAMLGQAKELGLGEGLVLSFGLSPAGLDAQVFLGLEPEAARRWSALSEGVQDAHLERLLPADSVFGFKLRLNIEALLGLASSYQPGFKAELEQAMREGQQALGQDVEKGSLRNLTGNFALGLRFGQPNQVNHLIRRLSRPAEAQEAALPQAFQLFYWAQIRDAAAWAQLLEALLPLLTERAGLAVDKQAAGALTSYRLSGGEIRYDMFLLSGQDVVGGCLGQGCAEEAAALAAGKAPALPGQVSRAARELLDAPSLAVGTLNFERVLAVLTGLDAAAFGEGGMLAKMALDLALTAVRNLKEFTAVLRFLPAGFLMAGHLEIQ